MLLLTVLIIIVCILLILIVLVQNPKGGGLSSSFGGGGSTQLFGGVKKTTDFLDRGTWVLAIALVALVLFANVTTPTAAETEQRQSEIEGQIDGAALPVPSSTLPVGDDNAVSPEQVPAEPAVEE